MNKLEEICATKRDEVAERQSATQVGELIARITAQAPPRGFEAALRQTHADGRRALIAEIKKASPSKGLIREDFQPAEHAKAYAAAGASCLSVLTDAPYFQGHADYLIAAREAVALPALRKDFMVDPWQCGEARAMGADAILIIVAALTDQQAQEIEAAADELGMDVLVEVHDAAEMERAHKLKSRLIGINNRDLRSFETDIATTEALIPLAPEGAFLISESGIATAGDCARLEEAGAHGFLVGESLMRRPDVEAATRALLAR
ncbi:indole-3-glycerol phosphate synthase TrpC [Alteriqipengyuania lutimaris]|uniref:Indole-3-glycerol phosphate synthase n=1 Tax=Alteriqipengyuania lutimaris TaxID=1538146 RepID=A0A395LM57_9SPHN|nr:indole-3-glycerol phosphate synthase TrpC [Alteriqipengyuania lutimaris]MBB3032815.1 indole-3-glycerol phosphate synthase [Alteriqipengyuania lutimaris]RDS78088.1 indole-3-glycerol phosphate synthase TrpC [Alteriqipengyuania lutimaris]